jgi:hypothetical protein
VRSRWNDKGVALPDECPSCAPGSFEKFTAPSDKKIWMGYEAHPNEYEKRYDKDGLIYERKPEYRAEQEQKLAQQTADERDAQQRAVAEKRATRRTDRMDSVELAAALRKAEEIASWINGTGGNVC